MEGTYLDPVTHAIIGLSVSKLAVNSISLSNPATLGIVAGSLIPDIDIVMQKWGDYAYLKNHRGATHSVVGIIISSLAVALILGGIFKLASIPLLFMWTMLGNISHVFFDIFNCYGSKLLWPFIKRKFSFAALMSFDPLLVSILAGCAFLRGNVGKICFVVLFLYMVMRILLQMSLKRKLVKTYGEVAERINIFPSVSGIFKWLFVIEKKDENIVGVRNFLRKKEKELVTLPKIDKDIAKRALESPLGRFFKDFSPVFHIEYERRGGINTYKFIDLRYYMKKNFLHHAILVVDDNNRILTSSFNPYSINRRNILTSRDLKHYTGAYVLRNENA